VNKGGKKGLGREKRKGLRVDWEIKRGSREEGSNPGRWKIVF